MSNRFAVTLFGSRTRRIAFGLVALFLVLGLWLHGSHPAAIAADAPNTEPIPKDVLEALKSLKTADSTGRRKIYDQLAEKGDARLIPAMQAFKDGKLLLIGDQFAIYGERVTLPDKGSVLPVIDAFNSSPVKGPDGQPIYTARVDLSKALKSPPYAERAAVNELLSGLSLLDPNPKARISSIRDVSERAARAFVDVIEQERFKEALKRTQTAIKAAKLPEAATKLGGEALVAMDATLADKPVKLTDPAPGATTTGATIIALRKLKEAIAPTAAAPTTAPATAAGPTPEEILTLVLDDTSHVSRDYQDRLDAQTKVLDDLPKYATALKRQYDKDSGSRYAEALKEAIAGTDAALGDRPTRAKAAGLLGEAGTSRSANVLQRLLDAAKLTGDSEVEKAAAPALSKAQSRQTRIQFVQNSFFGLSAGSILVLLALGLSIIFGLMGVINMAHGEFMMLGAFTTYVVSEGFKHLPPACYDYYLIAAIPAAFLVAGLAGFLCEYLVIRHLYGRPLETLLATFGVGLVIIWAVRKKFGDNVSVTPPKWMEGDIEIVPDLNLQLNRIYIILYCVICISVVYFIVNRTKLGLLLRATTQNREMASALGVATRRIDGITFAIGAGLAGLAGVAVPLYNKINPQIGQEYIVDSFMVVVVGGVGKLAGAIWAGLGLGFISKYLEPVLQNIKVLASGASVIGRVLVLAMIVVFLQFRPSGLFPPKGRNADA